MRLFDQKPIWFTCVSDNDRWRSKGWNPPMVTLPEGESPSFHSLRLDEEEKDGEQNHTTSHSGSGAKKNQKKNTASYIFAWIAVSGGYLTGHSFRIRVIV